MSKQVTIDPNANFKYNIFKRITSNRTTKSRSTSRSGVWRCTSAHAWAQSGPKGPVLLAELRKRQQNFEIDSTTLLPPAAQGQENVGKGCKIASDSGSDHEVVANPVVLASGVGKTKDQSHKPQDIDWDYGMPDNFKPGRDGGQCKSIQFKYDDKKDEMAQQLGEELDMDVFNICSSSLQLQSLPTTPKHLLDKSDHLASETETFKASITGAQTPSMGASSRPGRVDAQRARGLRDRSLQRLINQRRKKPVP